MVTLGIETSCDETAVALVDNGRILSSAVSSSVSLHERYGGVVPEIASRFHIEYINLVAKKALKKSKKSLSQLNLIAVTNEPGLPGSLLAGLSYARALSYSLQVPLIEVNHLNAHIYANFLNRNSSEIRFPFIGVVVSGGHTNIFICKSISDFEIVGRTQDDAIGEAFDKVAKVLGIGYPGGPRIERYARKIGRQKPINFPRVYLDKDSFDFSLSGVKTAVFYYVKNKKITTRDIAKICWSFQEVVFDVLVYKIIKACKKFNMGQILLGGGVVSNARLKKKLLLSCNRLGYNLLYPQPSLCIDNAAMTAGLGEELFKKGLR